MPADRESLEFMIRTTKRLMPDATWCAAGIGRHQPTLNRWCAELGGHCRTGLEDNVRLEKQTLAPSNAALVRKCVEILAEHDRRPATVTEARALLSLPAVG
jgi:3-keto-5-aminohexanoate cleavage enzyme